MKWVYLCGTVQAVIFLGALLLGLDLPSVSLFVVPVIMIPLTVFTQFVVLNWRVLWGTDRWPGGWWSLTRAQRRRLFRSWYAKPWVWFPHGRLRRDSTAEDFLELYRQSIQMFFGCATAMAFLFLANIISAVQCALMD